MKKINNPFAFGKVFNYRGRKEYCLPGIGNVIFSIDKNLSVYDVDPRKYNGHDVLSVVRGQVPDAAYNSLTSFVSKWDEDDARFN